MKLLLDVLCRLAFFPWNRPTQVIILYFAMASNRVLWLVHAHLHEQVYGLNSLSRVMTRI
jgi:hypothetical protein